MKLVLDGTRKNVAHVFGSKGQLVFDIRLVDGDLRIRAVDPQTRRHHGTLEVLPDCSNGVTIRQRTKA